MSVQQPRDDQGRFASVPQICHDGEVIVTLTEFECRMLGNRLWNLAEWYEKKSGIQADDELRKWAKKFHSQCSTRSDRDNRHDDTKRHLECDYHIYLKLNEFEANWLGNRLWEAGDRYDTFGQDDVSAECKWWARRFHAEAGECR